MTEMKFRVFRSNLLRPDSRSKLSGRCGARTPVVETPRAARRRDGRSGLRPSRPAKTLFRRARRGDVNTDASPRNINATTNDDDAAASRLGGAIARRPFVRSREASEATKGRPSDGSRAGRFRRWVGEAQPGRDAQGARRPRVPQVAEHTRMRRCDAVRGRSMGIPKSRGRGRLRSGGCAPHDALREGAGWKVRVPRPSAPRAKQRPSHAQAVRGPLLP